MGEPLKLNQSTWKIAAVASLVVAGLGMFATLLSIFVEQSALDTAAKLRLAAEAFNDEDWETAHSVSNALQVSPDWDESTRRLHAFLSSASAVKLAFLEPDDRTRRQWISDSVEDFQFSRSLGFPEQYRTEAIWLLGEALFETGDFTGAAEIWKLQIEPRLVDQRRYWLDLATSQLRSQRIPTLEAERTTRHFLELPIIDALERDQAQILLGRILATEGRWNDAREELAKIDQKSELYFESQLEKVRVTLAEVRSHLTDDSSTELNQTDFAALEEAQQELLDVARQASEVTGLDATYLAGQVSRAMKDAEKALGLLATVRQNRLDASVAIAAGLEELEILARRGTAEECSSTSTYLVRTIGNPHSFDPRWVSLEELRVRLSGVINQLKSRGEFQAAITIAREMIPVIDQAPALRLEGEIYAAWAFQLGSPGNALIDQVMQYHDNAGRAFEAAANLEFTSEDYPSFLWNAIEQFDQAHRYSKNLELLESYLRFEDRDQQPRGLILQGKSYLSLGDYESALHIFDTCIAEFPRDSLKYEARLLAATGAFELGKAEQAKKYLDENLHDGKLAPESDAWRDSLLLLGDFLFAEALNNHYRLTTPSPTSALPEISTVADQFEGNQELLESAIDRLEEAQIRYKGQRSIRHATYLAAQAHFYAAHWPLEESQLQETLDSGRRDSSQQYGKHLSAAAQTYRRLRDDLNQVEEGEELNPQEEIMLRNCYLGEADALFKLGEFDNAITVYSAAINRFINEPLSLEALIQQTRCFESMGRDEDVGRLLKQARQILDRIPPEHEDLFVQTTRYDREGWTEFLAWLSQS